MTSPSDDRPTKRRKIDGDTSPSEQDVIADVPASQPVVEQNAPKYHRINWAAAVSAHSFKSAKSESAGPPPLPLPPWDTEKQEEPARKVRTSCRTRADTAVPNEPDSLQQPCKVPVLRAERPVDYFPWTGKHPEDVINETNVKQGYWDRALHPVERELNTARTSLHNAFKHRSGLDSLSALFSLVLDRKSKHGALSTSSSFRPPPRVMLTEAKRKSWIADLADESVPLRRLSRTIPQGVRGVALLDHCLLHNVPSNRAIWFVKCVGANEIRTLKRKGANPTVIVGAEHKWLRDWTMNIEQFLETAVTQCGAQDWLRNLRYCLQLCTRLYHENLLDRDHFLDWIVKSFTTSGLQLSAVWLSFVQMWWIDLIRFRSRARLLSAALLTKLHDLMSYTAANDMLEKLKKATRGLMISRPAAFLMSDQWNENKEVLGSCLNLQNHREAEIFKLLDQRNARMLGRVPGTGKSGMVKLVFMLLDASTAPFDINKISEGLLALCPDRCALSNFCLSWATSRFRGGLSRTYLVARLLRRWLRNGADIADSILGFFSGCHRTTSVNTDSYRHLFAELSRSRSFSSSRFLQNLTLQGMHPEDSTASSTILEGQLLQDLSLLDAEEHVINLRNHLLKSAGKIVSRQDEDLQTVKDVLRRLLQESEKTPVAMAIQSIRSLKLGGLCWSTKFEISQWLREEAGDMAQYTMIEIPGRPPLPGSKVLVLNQYLLLREVLESLGDVAVLADVVSMLSRTKQESILAALVDTIHYNAVAFSAIGALEPLQRTYGQAYITLRTARPSLLLFATSLLDLCQDYPCVITPVRALQQDLIKGDRGRPLAACSPFSDGIAESLQQATSTFVDDFEAILQGEPNMSEQTMTSLFSVLVGRITKSDSEPHDQNTAALCQLLARLRLFRNTQGDALIKRWISRLFTATWSQVHQNIILELISTRCISIDVLLSICEQLPAASSCRMAVLDLVANGLLVATDEAEFLQQMYVVRISVRQFMRANPLRGLEILVARATLDRRAFDLYASILSKVLDDKGKLSTLSATATKHLSSIVDDFLGLRADKQDVLGWILCLSDWLSLPFCRYRLTQQTDAEGNSVYGHDVSQTGALVVETLQAKWKQGTIDVELIQALADAMPNEVAAQARAMTEQEFHNLMAKSFQGRGINPGMQSSTTDLAQCAEVVDRLVSLGPAKNVDARTDTNGMLIEKLTIMHKILGSKGEVTSGVGNLSATSPVSPGPSMTTSTNTMDQRQRDNVMGVLEHLRLVSRVASMKAGSFGSQVNTTNPASLKQVQTEQMKILALLASIATQPVLTQLLQSDMEEKQKNLIRDTMNFTLDVAARMADDLSEEGRGQCAKILKDKMRDERISWLVGSMNTNAASRNEAGQGLVVMHEQKGYICEYRPKQWEMLESGGGKEGDTCLGLGLFGAKRL